MFVVENDGSKKNDENEGIEKSKTGDCMKTNVSVKRVFPWVSGSRLLYSPSCEMSPSQLLGVLSQ